jgi:glycosyltransferase involved in cell wall biosynthesis
MNFSIILLNYNDSRYLINWLEKYNKSTVKTELIVVDDCSTDHSWRLLIYLQQKYPYMRLVRTPKNLGPFGAFMWGVHYATNDYVSPWSADDEMGTDYVAKMSQLIKDYPFCDIFTCNALVEKEDRHYRREALPFDSYISPDYLHKVAKTSGISAVNVIGNVVRKDHVIKCWEMGKPWVTHFDAFYLFTAAFKTGMIIAGEPLVLYRSNNKGFGNSRKRKDNLSSVRKMRNLFNRFGIEKYFDDLDLWSDKATIKTEMIFRILQVLPKWLRRRIYDRVYSRSFV